MVAGKKIIFVDDDTGEIKGFEDNLSHGDAKMRRIDFYAQRYGVNNNELTVDEWHKLAAKNKK